MIYEYIFNCIGNHNKNMQQWFELDQSKTDLLIGKLHKIPKNDMPLLKTFTVEAETKTGQHICVSGNCSTLGNCEVNDALVLTNTNFTYTRNE